MVAGIFNGAFMAHRPALEASAQVAVLATVAGGLPPALSDLRPTHAVSVPVHRAGTWAAVPGYFSSFSPVAEPMTYHSAPNASMFWPFISPGAMSPA